MILPATALEIGPEKARTRHAMRRERDGGDMIEDFFGTKYGAQNDLL